MKIAFVFPGQGSQAVGMAAGFADNAAAAAVMKTADAALGESLSGLIAEGPAEKLNLTVNTQPAVLSVSYALYSAWRAALSPLLPRGTVSANTRRFWPRAPLRLKKP